MRFRFFHYKESINNVDRVMSKCHESSATLTEAHRHSEKDLITSRDSLLDALDQVKVSGHLAQ